MKGRMFDNIRRTMLCLGLAGTLFFYTGQPIPAAEGDTAAESAVLMEEAAETMPDEIQSEQTEETLPAQTEEILPAQTEEILPVQTEEILPEPADVQEEEPVAAQEAGPAEEPAAAQETGPAEEPAAAQETGPAEEPAAENSEEESEEMFEEEEVDPGEEEEALEDVVPEGEEVAAAIHEIIEASSQLVFADQDGVERLQDYIAETEEAYNKLTPDEKDILAGSFENLGHASAAVDVMQESMEQLDQTGTIILEQSRNENSWRFIDGVPVKEALAVVEEEAIEVAEAVPDENLLTSYQQAETAVPKGELLGLPVPAGDQAHMILVDENSVKEGIDVSEWQYVIDWPKVKEGGIDFAIIRCGYGNDFVSQDDDYWLRNVEACEEYGIPYGVYLYSKATTEWMIDSEVAHTLRLLQGHNPQLPVYLDIEENSQILLGDARLSKLADRYCSKIIQAGYKSGIYAGTYGWERYLTLVAKNDNYFHWVAQWNPKGCSYAGRYEMWQYDVKPGVPGIDGDVDRDVWYGALPEASATVPVPKPVTDTDPHIGYKSHVQSFGWEGSWIRDGAMSGTEGQSKRLEGIQIEIENDKNLGVEYRTHIQTYGWESVWKKDGEISGTTGEGKRLEAIQIRLTGKDAEKYDVYYCVHAQNFGWLNWAKNGESAGTAGYSYRLEAIQIQLVKKGDPAPASLGDNALAFRQPLITYNTHVQTYGWQDYKSDGDMAGTTGQSKRLEGIHIQLVNQPYTGNVEYRTHVQTYGWESGWRRNGAMSGTSGQSKRLEAIQIRLTGGMAQKYDIYYQTHVQQFGWTDWAKNGESCGSAGYSYRLEGIRIVLVEKGGNAPGSTANKFYQR